MKNKGITQAELAIRIRRISSAKNWDYGLREIYNEAQAILQLSSEMFYLFMNGLRQAEIDAGLVEALTG